MSDWIRRFEDDCKSQHLSQQTIDKYVNHLKFIRDKLKCNLENCRKESLLKAYAHYSNRKAAYHRYIGILIRQALRFLGRKELVEFVKLPKMSVIKKDRESNIKEKIIPAEDIKKLIEKAPNRQDRLLVYILYESGARAGEIYNIKIKDVQFDDYSGLVWLRGKSGTRRARIIECTPDLRDQINNHPEKGNPNARLFHYGIKGSSDFHIRTFNNVVRRLGERILGRPIHPHQFRHTRATLNSSLFTDREMMILFGWKRTDMIEIYSHLSQRDVDHKVLVMHGLKPKDEILKPLTEKRTCGSCNEENAPYAIYCNKCGAALSKVLGEQDTKEIVEQIIKNPEAFKILRDAMGDIVGAKLSPIEKRKKK